MPALRRQAAKDWLWDLRSNAQAQRRGGCVPRPLQRLVRRHWFAHLMSCGYPLPASAMMRRSMDVNGGTSSMAVFHNTARLTCM
jgi:hypothetical protein